LSCTSVPLHDALPISVDGTQMAEQDWGAGEARTLGVFLNGHQIPNPNPKGDPVGDDDFFLIFNAHHEPQRVTLPGEPWGRSWQLDRKSTRLNSSHVKI